MHGSVVIGRGGGGVGGEAVSSPVVVVDAGGVEQSVHGADPACFQLLLGACTHAEQRLVRCLSVVVVIVVSTRHVVPEY